MSVTLRTRLVETAGDLAALEPAWWTLWRRQPHATPFQSPAWLIPWWASFGPGELASVAVFRSECLAAFAPLYRDAQSGHLLPLGVSVSDFHDVLLDPAEPAAVASLARMIAQVAPGRQAFWPDVPLDANLEILATQGGLFAVWSDGETCPDIPLEPGQEPVPAPRRRKLRMAWHRARRRGDVALRSAAEIGTDEWLAALFRLHGARWRGRGELGVLHDEQVRTFHGRAVPSLQSAGLLDGTALFIDDRVAGVYYGLRWGPAAYAYLGGFDPAFERESPGTILLGDAIARASAAGCRRFSLLRGREAYKYEWGAVDRLNRTLSLTPGQTPP